MKHFTRGFATILLAAAFGLAPGAASAQPVETAGPSAIPPDCSASRYPYASWASQSLCTRRAHRAAAKCRVYRVGERWYFGPWANAGQRSIAYCPATTQQFLQASVDYPD